MRNSELKAYLMEQFKEVYGEEYRLLAVQLDGFSHAVLFDKGTKDSRIERESSSAYTIIDERAFEMLGTIPHHQYQGNATEIIYVYPMER